MPVARFNTRPDQEGSRDGTLGFLSRDEAYATAMLVVVKAHQSRAGMQNQVLPKGIENCPPMAGLSSSSPGSFVIAMTPTCDWSFPQ